MSTPERKAYRFKVYSVGLARASKRPAKRIALCVWAGVTVALMGSRAPSEHVTRIEKIPVVHFDLATCRDYVARNRDTQFVPVAGIVPTTETTKSELAKGEIYNEKDNALIAARFRAEGQREASRDRFLSNATKEADKKIVVPKGGMLVR